MILFFYNLALLAALVVSAPWWLFRMATTHKYREGLMERLGWGKRTGPGKFKGRLANVLIRVFIVWDHWADFWTQRLGRLKRGGNFKGRLPRRKWVDGKITPESSIDRPLIWVHAVSVGEVLAVSRLVKTLDAALPGYLIVVSTTTRTGQALARERFGANRVFYCPLDLPWAVRAVLNALQPRLLVLAETEFWPNLLSGCCRRGIPVAVVNARISDRSWPRYRILRRLWKPFLGGLSRVLAQSETDAERLTAIGCLPERVTVAGNLKFDVRAAEEAEATRQLKALAPGLRFVVAGSTLEGEEAALLEAWPRLLGADPQLLMVLAVRHPERFAAVAALLDQSGLPWVRRSEWKTAPKPLIPGQIVLLDTIGELASVYSLASVAFVGGSLIPAGGHNPLEPAQFGVPIVMGPHTFNFRAITEDLLAHHAVRIAAKEELAAVLIELLQNRTEAKAMGERAKQVFGSQAGATGRCVDALKKLLPAQAETEKPT
jgi:3-deoxy-D-manno-octulosonic-acid transferase